MEFFIFYVLPITSILSNIRTWRKAFITNCLLNDDNTFPDRKTLQCGEEKIIQRVCIIYLIIVTVAVIMKNHYKWREAFGLAELCIIGFYVLTQGDRLNHYLSGLRREMRIHNENSLEKDRFLRK